MKCEESRLQSLCESYLTMRHIPYLHLTTVIKRKIAGRFFCLPVPGMTGYPDLIIFMPRARVLLVELKSEKGVLSTDQKRVFTELGAKGHIVFTIRSFEAFKELVDERIKGGGG
jgi:hypothetical protein